MRIRPYIIIKLLILVVVFTYVSLVPINSYSYKIDAFLVLILSIALVIKGKNNLPLTLMFIFILYVNYSVVIAEYFIGGKLSVPFNAVKTKEIYGTTIRIMLLFMSIITVFFNGRRFDLSKDKIKPRDNWIVFYLIIFVLVYSLIVGVERGDFDSYEVKISPIFEYAKLLFLFAYFYSGESKVRKAIIFILVATFILQDTYYGGRITSLQLFIFLAVTLLVNKLSFVKIISFSIIGIVLMRIVAVYRNSYAFIDFSINSLINSLFNNYFVFDTATFAYYASATHVAAAESSDIGIRFNSLYQFAISVVVGSQDISSDVTSLVVKLGFFNLGGGLLPTHFYFWLGWFGVIGIGFLIVFLINNLKYESIYQNLLFLGIIINIPRWYLYSPNQLFRGGLFFITILFIIFWIVNEFSFRRDSIKNFKIKN